MSVFGWVVVKEENGVSEIVKPVYDVESGVFNKLGFGATLFNFKRLAIVAAESLNDNFEGDAKFLVVKGKIIKEW